MTTTRILIREWYRSGCRSERHYYCYADYTIAKKKHENHEKPINTNWTRNITKISLSRLIYLLVWSRSRRCAHSRPTRPLCKFHSPFLRFFFSIFLFRFINFQSRKLKNSWIFVLFLIFHLNLAVSTANVVFRCFSHRPCIFTLFFINSRTVQARGIGGKKLVRGSLALRRLKWSRWLDQGRKNLEERCFEVFASYRFSPHTMIHTKREKRKKNTDIHREEPEETRQVSGKKSWSEIPRSSCGFTILICYCEKTTSWKSTRFFRNMSRLLPTRILYLYIRCGDTREKWICVFPRYCLYCVQVSPEDFCLIHKNTHQRAAPLTELFETSWTAHKYRREKPKREYGKRRGFCSTRVCVRFDVQQLDSRLAWFGWNSPDAICINEARNDNGACTMNYVALRSNCHTTKPSTQHRFTHRLYRSLNLCYDRWQLHSFHSVWVFKK